MRERRKSNDPLREADVGSGRWRTGGGTAAPTYVLPAASRFRLR
jgi:hypothetical protein